MIIILKNKFTAKQIFPFLFSMTLFLSCQENFEFPPVSHPLPAPFPGDTTLVEDTAQTLSPEDSERIAEEIRRYLVDRDNRDFDSIKLKRQVPRIWVVDKALMDTLPLAPCHPSHYPPRVYIAQKVIDRWIAKHYTKAGHDPYMSKQTAYQIPIPEVPQLLLEDVRTGSTHQAYYGNWIPLVLFKKWYIPEELVKNDQDIYSL